MIQSRRTYTRNARSRHYADQGKRFPVDKINGQIIYIVAAKTAYYETDVGGGIKSPHFSVIERVCKRVPPEVIEESSVPQQCKFIWRYE